MLLKATIAAIAFFAGSVGVLRVSVLLENYALLGAGLVLAIAAVAVGMRQQSPA